MKGPGLYPAKPRAPATRDDRAQDEEPDIVAGKAGRDGHELIGDRREALEQDDHGAPFGIGGAEGVDLAAEAIDFDQPMADRVEEQRTDSVAQKATQHRRRSADRRIDPGALRARQ